MSQSRVQISRPLAGPENYGDAPGPLDGHRYVSVDGVRVGLIQPAYSQGRRNREWVISKINRENGREVHTWIYQTHTLARAIAWAQEYDRWPITRYAALSGSQGGYLPDYTSCCDSRESAIYDLCELHDVSPRGRMARELRQCGQSTRIPLSSGYGNGRWTSLGGVVEVTQCSCETCLRATIGDDMSDCEECQNA